MCSSALGPGTGSTCGDAETCPDTEACDDGFHTACGACNEDCSAIGSGATCGDGAICPDSEVCDDGFATDCGACNGTCTGQGSGSYCGDGVLCPDTEACDDGDASSCGACDAKCTGPGGVCGCAKGSAEQSFAHGMVGCAGVVTFPQRASLCAAGSRPCTPGEWVAWHGATAPTYNYWTSDPLPYYLGPYDACMAASAKYAGYSACSSPDSGMRVCAAASDPLKNACNWTGCGLAGVTSTEWFGGCDGNTTAGTLCCPK